MKSFMNILPMLKNTWFGILVPATWITEKNVSRTEKNVRQTQSEGFRIAHPAEGNSRNVDASPKP